MRLWSRSECWSRTVTPGTAANGFDNRFYDFGPARFREVRDTFDKGIGHSICLNSDIDRDYYITRHGNGGMRVMDRACEIRSVSSWQEFKYNGSNKGRVRLCVAVTRLRLARTARGRSWDCAEMPEDYQPRYNVAPTQPVAVVANADERKAEWMRWGLIPFWAKDPSDWQPVDQCAFRNDQRKTSLQECLCEAALPGSGGWLL